LTRMAGPPSGPVVSKPFGIEISTRVAIRKLP
jgi:hypothetical protein